MKRAAPVRRARAADARAIHALEEHFPSDRMSLRSVRGFLRSPRAQVWVSDGSDLRLHGCLILLTRAHSRKARIYSVVVDPAARGQGLGVRLVQAAQSWARGHGCTQVYLEVREDNHAARALYAKLGYAESARLPGFYDDGADGLRLARPLTRARRR
ncbi:MAG TPA: GNAT family N-acetyltransferase [Nevskiaceae bacterium]|nr:GNAT family N-acetyltransferase [Nevskiaceae bacterium]